MCFAVTVAYLQHTCSILLSSQNKPLLSVLPVSRMLVVVLAVCAAAKVVWDLQVPSMCCKGRFRFQVLFVLAS
jgi:hypothetical protein